MDTYKTPTPSEDFPAELPKSVEEAVIAFSHTTETPVTLFDNRATIKWEYNQKNKICTLFDLYCSPNSICSKSLHSSMKLAAKLGEPYIFVCHAGFVKIAISLIIDSKIVGCFMVGPIVMGSIRESIINNILNLNNVSPKTYAKLILFLKKMKIFSPKDVSSLSTLLKHCIYSSTSQNMNYAKISTKQKEQSEIGKMLQIYKKQNKSMSYPYDMESELILRVKRGENEEAQKILKSLLNKISILESGDLTLIKTRVIELCAVLSRAILEVMPDTQEIDFGSIDTLNEAENFNELCTLTWKIVNNFIRSTFDSIYSGDSSIINQALRYIQANYMNQISLADLSKSLHVCSSYLSTLFKQEMGITFTDYINELRIKKSKELLASTTLSILDISIHTGFGDQSYFTKVFKKLEGKTPSQYRKQLKKEIQKL